MRRYPDISRPLGHHTTGDKLTVVLAWLAGIMIAGLFLDFILALISRTA